MNGMSDTTTITADSFLKTRVGLLWSILCGMVAATWIICSKVNAIDAKIDNNHADCIKFYDNSWHIEDEAWKVRLYNATNCNPDPSQVLIYSRGNKHGSQLLRGSGVAD